MPAMRPEVTETRSPWRRSGSHWGDVRIGRRHRAVGALEERSLGLGGSRARREAGAGAGALRRRREYVPSAALCPSPGAVLDAARAVFT